MSPEVRRMALRAAAASAFVVGCSGNKPPPAATGDRLSDAACVAHLDSMRMVDRNDLPADDPLHDETDVYGAFADRDGREAPATRDCCVRELVAVGSSGPHRFACCSAVDWRNAPERDQFGSACIPWGPPMPPALRA
jgi:hypothetical protein